MQDPCAYVFHGGCVLKRARRNFTSALTSASDSCEPNAGIERPSAPVGGLMPSRITCTTLSDDRRVDRGLQRQRHGGAIAAMALRAARLEHLGALAEFLRHRRRVRAAPFEPQRRGPGGGLVDRFLSGAQRVDISGDREHVDLVLLVQGIDDRCHRPGRHAVLRVPAVHQVGDELELGPWLLREVVLVERRRVPAFGAAAAIGRRRARTQEIARAVAGGAMAETFDQIGALVPRGILRWIRPERGLVEEQRLPDRERGADVEGKAEIVARASSPAPARPRPSGRHRSRRCRHP